MANPWFRLYSEIQDDPDVQMLPEFMRWRFIALLCSRCKSDELSDSVIAFQWRVPASEVRETKVLFISKGFIDENWNVLNWDKRQYVSDSSKERTQRYRQKRHRDVTDSVTVTLPEQIQNRTEQRESPIKKYF